MTRFFLILTTTLLLTACSSSSDNYTQTNSADSASNTTVDYKQTTSRAGSVIIPETFLHDTTIVSGNIILFLRPDSARFESYTKDPQSGIYETDSDFGFGIKNTQDSISKNKEYKAIKVIVSTNRYIIIEDCKNCPLTIDRDTIDYGVILSSTGRQIKTTYGFVHSSDYIQEIDEYFNTKK